MENTISLNDHLSNCIIACDNCANACLHEEDVAKMSRCIKTDIDCSDICTLTFRLVNRDSENLPEVLKACIAACKTCEEECRKHDMDHCQECADACHQCHTSCEEYLQTLDY